MSEDWDNVTKIGKNVRSGGATAREKVVRSEKDVAAAKRAGVPVSTEKKFVVRFPYEQISTLHPS
jgi:putative transcription factor